MSCWVRVCFCCLKNRGSIRVSIEYRAWCLLSQSQRSLLLRGGPLRHISSEIVLFFKKQWMLLVKRKGELLVLRSLISMNKQLISCSWRALQKGKTDFVYFGWFERVVLHISSRTFLLGLWIGLGSPQNKLGMYIVLGCSPSQESSHHEDIWSTNYHSTLKSPTIHCSFILYIMP